MLWKIYFWFITVISILSCIDDILVGVNLLNSIDLVITLIFTIGFFGYVYQKQFFVQIFWKIWFVVDILWTFIYLPYIFEPDDWAIIQSREGVIILTIILLFIIPSYFALYRYAFRMKEFWNLEQDTNTASKGIN